MRPRGPDRPPIHPADSTDPTVPYASLAFGELVGGLAGREGVRILDLGPAVTENIRFLTGLPSKLYIADLHQNLAPHGGRPASFPGDLPEVAEGSVDAILAWDLLNYLRGDEIGALGRRLEPYCRPGTRLFASIWTLAEQPDRPLVFRIADREHLSFTPRSELRRPSPRYKEPDLGRRLRRFEVETAYLLRNGLQEFLFSYAPPAPGSP